MFVRMSKIIWNIKCELPRIFMNSCNWSTNLSFVSEHYLKKCTYTITGHVFTYIRNCDFHSFLTNNESTVWFATSGAHDPSIDVISVFEKSTFFSDCYARIVFNDRKRKIKMFKLVSNPWCFLKNYSFTLAF